MAPMFSSQVLKRVSDGSCVAPVQTRGEPRYRGLCSGTWVCASKPLGVPASWSHLGAVPTEDPGVLEGSK